MISLLLIVLCCGVHSVWGIHVYQTKWIDTFSGHRWMVIILKFLPTSSLGTGGSGQHSSSSNLSLVSTVEITNFDWLQNFVFCLDSLLVDRHMGWGWGVKPDHIIYKHELISLKCTKQAAAVWTFLALVFGQVVQVVKKASLGAPICLSQWALLPICLPIIVISHMARIPSPWCLHTVNKQLTKACERG